MSESKQIELFNARLAECQSQRRQAAKISAKLAEVERQLLASRRTLYDANRTLRSESNDVEAFEGLTLTALFYTILGTHEQRLEKERQEQLSAKLKRDAALDTVDSLDAEVVELKNQLDTLGNFDRQFEAILQEKSDYLHQTSDPSAARLIELAEELTDLRSQEKELLEAVHAGEQAVGTLREVQSCLSSALNWGTVDLMGGGMLATMAKHSRIDAARRHAHTAQRELLRFQQELADANERLHVSLEIGGFARFADYFFDGLIADWIVQSKITRASGRCGDVLLAVRTALHKCQYRLSDVRQEIKQRERERRQMIESV